MSYPSRKVRRLSSAERRLEVPRLAVFKDKLMEAGVYPFANFRNGGVAVHVLKTMWPPDRIEHLIYENNPLVRLR
jgi:hypothetical protein